MLYSIYASHNHTLTTIADEDADLVMIIAPTSGHGCSSSMVVVTHLLLVINHNTGDTITKTSFDVHRSIA